MNEMFPEKKKKKKKFKPIADLIAGTVDTAMFVPELAGMGYGVVKGAAKKLTGGNFSEGFDNNILNFSQWVKDKTTDITGANEDSVMRRLPTFYNFMLKAPLKAAVSQAKPFLADQAKAAALATGKAMATQGAFDLVGDVLTGSEPNEDGALDTYDNLMKTAAIVYGLHKGGKFAYQKGSDWLKKKH